MHPDTPKELQTGVWTRTLNAEASNHLVGQLKTRKVDWLYDPFRKLLGALAAPFTEHVQAASRMLRRAPVRILLRGSRCLLAQPELPVAGPASFSSRGPVVVSEPPRPSFPAHPPRLGCPFPETAVMSARLPTLSPPQRSALLLLSLLLAAAPGPRPGAAFYLPGLAPVNFCDEEKKSDECKVGEAWRTLSALTEGEVTLTRGAGFRGEGGVAGMESTFGRSAWGRPGRRSEVLGRPFGGVDCAGRLPSGGLGPRAAVFRSPGSEGRVRAARPRSWECAGPQAFHE